MIKPEKSLAAEGFSENRRAQVYKGVLDLAVLGLLRDGPEYGLEILDGLREDAGLEVAAGSLYPLLHRLESTGLIRANWRHDADASHGRKYYSLTTAGKRDFGEQSAAWLSMSARLNTFLKRRLR